MKRIVGLSWQDYRQKVMHKDASNVQVMETRKGFYAGASTVFFLLKERLGEQDNPPSEDDSLLDDLYAELCEFADADGNPAKMPS